MLNWRNLFLCIVLVAGKPNNEKDCPLRCQGEEYECIDGKCTCADGFIPNYYHNSCVKCPELGQKCFGTCCNTLSNESLQCWQGRCQPCYDANGNWKCRDTVDQFFLITTTQLIMGAALVLGIIATMMLLFKLCTVSHLRALGTLGSRSDSDRHSIGSLQMYVDERLRDAPPRYSRTPQTTIATSTPAAYTNNCFVNIIADGSIPPPSYAEVIKNENNQNASVHM